MKDAHTTVAAMQAASKQLKTEHKKIDIDKIEDMNDDLADMFEDMNEVSEVSVPKTERPRERDLPLRCKQCFLSNMALVFIEFSFSMLYNMAWSSLTSVHMLIDTTH